MKKKSKILVFLLIIAAAVYFFSIHENPAKIKEGQQAPSFILPSREGKLSLEQYRGRVVLLNFWATWCPPCIDEMPSLENLKKIMEGKDFEILAVNIDEEGWPAVDRFMKQHPLTLVVLSDPLGDVASRYGTYQLPESYLIDKQGVIVKKYIGSKNWEDPAILKEINSYVH